MPISCVALKKVSKRIFNKKNNEEQKCRVAGSCVVDRAFIFITAQKRLQYIASVATVQRIEERLIFSRVIKKARTIFFSVLAGSLTKIE